METTSCLFITGQNDFECVGNKCIDNCCHTWNITVDPITLKKYKDCKNPYSNYILSNIKKNPKGSFIKLTENGLCTFLDEQGLCNIYKKLGRDYMCRTCQIYPRVHSVYDGVTQTKLTLSCPYVAKLFLFNPTGIHFTLQENCKKVFNEKPHNNELPADIGFDIRTAVITIFQNRELSLTERIIYCSIFIDRIEKIIEAEGKNEESLRIKINECIDNFYEYYTNETIAERLLANSSKYDSGIASIYHLLIKALCVLLKQPFKTNQNESFYLQLDDLLQNVSNLNPDEMKKCVDKLLKPYMNEKPYIFENLIVVMFYNSDFPIERTSVLKAYKEILYKYNFILAFATAICRNKEEITDDDMINAVYYYGRKVEHQMSEKISEYYGKLSEIFKDLI